MEFILHFYICTIMFPLYNWMLCSTCTQLFDFNTVHLVIQLTDSFMFFCHIRCVQLRWHVSSSTMSWQVIRCWHLSFVRRIIDVCPWTCTFAHRRQSTHYTFQVLKSLSVYSLPVIRNYAYLLHLWSKNRWRSSGPATADIPCLMWLHVTKLQTFT